MVPVSLHLSLSIPCQRLAPSQVSFPVPLLCGEVSLCWAHPSCRLPPIQLLLGSCLPLCSPPVGGGRCRFLNSRTLTVPALPLAGRQGSSLAPSDHSDYYSGCSGGAGTAPPALGLRPHLPAAPAPLLSSAAPGGSLLLMLLLSLPAQAQQRGPATRGPASQGEEPGGLCDSCQWLLNLLCLPPHRGTLRLWAGAASRPPSGLSRSGTIPRPLVSGGLVIYKLRKAARLRQC